MVSGLQLKVFAGGGAHRVNMGKALLHSQETSNFTFISKKGGTRPCPRNPTHHPCVAYFVFMVYDMLFNPMIGPEEGVHPVQDEQG